MSPSKFTQRHGKFYGTRTLVSTGRGVDSEGGSTRWWSVRLARPRFLVAWPLCVQTVHMMGGTPSGLLWKSIGTLGEGRIPVVSHEYIRSDPFQFI